MIERHWRLLPQLLLPLTHVLDLQNKRSMIHFQQRQLLLRQSHGELTELIKEVFR
jgi:hypothetical protein